MNSPIHLPAGCAIEPGANGLPRLTVRGEHGDADIYQHGSHITHFQPRGEQPVIWLSKKSWFEKDKPIRGGVPICFPWFGPKPDDKSAPAHGFARLMDWTLKNVTQSHDGSIVVNMELQSNNETQKWWPADFLATHRVTVGRSLKMELIVKNTAAMAASFTEALHTYFAVADVREVSVSGLAGATYLNKARGSTQHTQGESPIRFIEETDRPYLDTTATCVLHDPLLKRSIRIAKSGSKSTVVWNPWIEKAKAMIDFGDDEWPGMCCIETANVLENSITIQPNGSHALIAEINVEPL